MASQQQGPPPQALQPPAPPDQPLRRMESKGKGPVHQLLVKAAQKLAAATVNKSSSSRKKKGHAVHCRMQTAQAYRDPSSSQAMAQPAASIEQSGAEARKPTGAGFPATALHDSARDYLNSGTAGAPPNATAAPRQIDEIICQVPVASNSQAPQYQQQSMGTALGNAACDLLSKQPSRRPGSLQRSCSEQIASTPAHVGPSPMKLHRSAATAEGPQGVGATPGSVAAVVAAAAAANSAGGDRGWVLHQPRSYTHRQRYSLDSRRVSISGRHLQAPCNPQLVAPAGIKKVGSATGLLLPQEVFASCSSRQSAELSRMAMFRASCGSPMHILDSGFDDRELPQPKSAEIWGTWPLCLASGCAGPQDISIHVSTPSARHPGAEQGTLQHPPSSSTLRTSATAGVVLPRMGHASAGAVDSVCLMADGHVIAEIPTDPASGVATGSVEVPARGFRPGSCLDLTSLQGGSTSGGSGAAWGVDLPCAF